MNPRKLWLARWAWTLCVLGALACSHPEPEPQDDGSLSPGARGEARFVAGEGTLFKLRTRAGQMYRFECDPTSDELWCEIQLVEESTRTPVGERMLAGPGQKAVLYWKAPETGAMWLDARSSNASERDSFQYAFDEAADDVGDTLEEATPLSLPGTISGEVELPTDVDVWRFSLPEGHILSAMCGDALRAIEYDIVRSDGVVVGGYFQEWVLNLPESYRAKNTGGGDLFVRIRPSRLRQGLHYQCEMTDLGPDDHPDAPPGGTPVAVSGTTQVSLEFVGDVDVLAVELLGGSAYTLSSNPGSVAPYYLATTVTDEQGNVLGTDLPTMRDGYTLTVPHSGRYFLSLHGVRDPLGGIWKWQIPWRFTYAITEQTEARGGPPTAAPLPTPWRPRPCSRGT